MIRGEFTRQEVHWLLSGHCHLTATGVLVWREENSNYRADLLVTADGFDVGALSLCYRIGKKRASEPAILLLLRRTSMLRLDVNGSHREGLKQYVQVTHFQQATKPGAAEEFRPHPVTVVPVAFGERVGGDVYREVLAGFAAESNLDIQGVTWEDPPEGRQP